MTGATVAMAMLAASLPGNYDCVIEHRTVITETGAAPAGAEVNFPGFDGDAWRFALRVPRGDAPEAVVTWAADPIQIAGTHASLPLGPGQIAFMAVSPGPCMFTEQACATLVALSARDDGSAAFSILPAGSTRSESGVRSLFHVVFNGTCRRRNGAER
ncbi:MAG: hypothetical protein QOH47_352 [Sphingomonadales bacterium]|jgi:hypothetical protein|nr:hypothetical protein [Sphingomonadales bacterium]